MFFKDSLIGCVHKIVIKEFVNRVIVLAFQEVIRPYEYR